MKKLSLALYSLLTLLLAATAPVAYAGKSVPVDFGEGAVTVTIPVLVNDNSVVIQAATSREMPSIKGEVMIPYWIMVYYPAEWGQPSVQHHLTVAGKGGVYTLTFAKGGLENRSSISFTLDLGHPLANMEKADRDRLMPELEKLFKGKAENLTLSPRQWLMEWLPMERGELRKIAGLGNVEDDLISTEKVKLPSQVGGERPFTLKKVSMAWGVADRDELKNLVSQDEVAPFLMGIPYSLSVKDPTIRVKEGYLKRRMTNWVGQYVESEAWEWVSIRNKTAIQVLPFTEYYVAVKR